MSGQITDLQVTFTPTQPDGYLAVGKVNESAYIWKARGEGDPILAARVCYDDESPGDGWVKIEGNLNSAIENATKAVYIYVTKAGETSEIVDCKIVSSALPVIPAGFNKLSNNLNPDAHAMQPKQYLATQTREALRKIETHDYEKGDKLDVLDGTTWRTARCRDTRLKDGVKEIYIAFDGWESPKWDEWLNTRTQAARIAPIGKNTKGEWTGGSGARPFNLSENMEKFADHVSKIKAILEAKEIDDEHETFLAKPNLDFLGRVLSATLDDEEELVPAVVEFLQINLDVVLRALARPDKALAKFYTIMIAHMFNSNAKFYTDYGTAEGSKVKKGAFAVRNSKIPPLASSYLIETINYFGDHGGFVSIKRRLVAIGLPETKAHARDSFPTITLIVRCIASIKDVLNKKFAQSYVTELNLQQAVTLGLKHITDDELRNLKQQELTALTTHVDKLLRITESDKVIAEFIEKINLDIALRLLSAQVLKNRINGMRELATTIERINLATNPDYKSHSAENDYVQSGRGGAGRRQGYGGYGAGGYGGYGQQQQQPVLTKAEYLTADYMINWLEENNVLNAILDPNQHEQVIKLSPVVLKFLGQNHALTSAHIDLLWAYAKGKHEGLVRIVYETLADIAGSMTEEQLDFLYERIQKKPFEEYKEFDLNYVKSFTMNAVKATKASKTPKWYGLDLFWQMIQDENVNVLEADIINQARVILKEMLSQNQFRPQRDTYVKNCLHGITQDKSAKQCIQLLELIISISDEEKTISALENTVSVIDMVLSQASRYMEAAKAAVAEKKITEITEETRLLVHTHKEEVQVRLNFLSYLCSRSALHLSQDHIDKLWNTFVVNSICSLDIAWTLDWLKSAASHPKEHYATLNNTVIKYVFENLLCAEQKSASGQVIPVNMEWYQCFESYFAAINYKAECLLSSAVTWLVVTNYADLTGLPALWAMSLSPIEEVAAAARHFLTTIHVRLDFGFSAAEKKEIYNNFTIKCMNKLQTAAQGDLKDEENQKRITEGVGLLASFLKRVESGEAMKRPLYNTGEEVRAYWKSTRTTKYPARIKEVNPDGTYQVAYDDGDFDPKCPETNLFTVHEETKERKVMAEDDSHLEPRIILSSNAEYFDLFFKLLGLGGELGHRVWRLLAQLPPNAQLKGKLADLGNTSDTVDWEAFLPSESVMKLLYTLEIVKTNIMLDQQVQEQQVEGAPALTRQRSQEIPPAMQRWCKMFVNSGGFEHIYKIFMSTDEKVMFQGGLAPRCFALVLQLITYFLTAQTNAVGVDGSEVQRRVNGSDFTTKLLTTLRVSVELKENVGETQARDISRIASRIFQIVGALITIDHSVVKTVAAFDFDEIVVSGLLHNGSSKLRKALAQGFIFLVNDFSDSKLYQPTPREFFQPILLKQLDAVDTANPNIFCTELFHILENLLAESTDLGTDPKPLATQLTKLICEHPFLETSDKTVDPVFGSLLSLATQLVKCAPELKDLLGGPDSLLENVVHSLFDLPSTTSNEGIPPPKCKSAATRQSAFALLAELCRDSEQNVNLATTMLEPNHLVTHSGRASEWAFSPIDKDEKGRQGYVGLRNLGCICYMNSAMQQLFMIPKLRHNVLAVDKYEEEDLSKSLIYNLQYMFGHLQESGKMYINPKPFTDIWTDETGQPINVGKQEDSGGFINKLIDRFNELVKGTRHAGAFKEVMGGVLAHQLIGQNECKHFKSRDEEYYTIQVEIRNKKTLQESLAAFVEGELLSGDNAYRCSSCNKKVDTLRRTVISKLPPVLCVTLKRFELDFTTWQPKKINDRIEFPMELDMKPYTAESLTSPEQWEMAVQARKRDAAEAREAARAAAAAEAKAAEAKGEAPKPVAEIVEEEEEEKDTGLPERAPEYYKYKLHGVVVHTGTAHSGHYYSFIQERLVADPSKPTQDGSWFKFNDSVVSPFNVAQLEDETFGGNKGPRSWGGIANGYLLFYDRVAPAPVSKPMSDTPISLPTAVHATTFANKMSRVVSRKAEPARVRVPPTIFEQIWSQNLRYWRDKNTFDPNYFEFLWELVHGAAGTEVQDVKSVDDVNLSSPNNVRDALTRLSTRFLFMTLARAAKKESVSQWIGQLKKLYSNNVASSVWLLNMMCNTQLNWSFQLLFECPSTTVRRGVADLLIIALKNVSPLEQGAWAKPLPEKNSEELKKEAEEEVKREPSLEEPKHDPRGFAVGFLERLLFMLSYAPVYEKHFGDYFRLLSTVASMGPAEASFLHRQDIPAKIIDLYLGPHSPHPEIQVHRTDSRTGKRIYMRDPDLTHMFQCLATLVVHHIGEVSPITQEMLHSKQFLSSFLMEALSYRRAVSGVIPLILAICKDVPMVEQVASLMGEGIRLHNHEQVRPYFRVFMALVTREGGPDPEAVVEILMTTIMAELGNHLRYWKFCDFVIDHVLRMAKKSPRVKAWLKAHPQQLDLMTQWLTDHPKPPSARDPSAEMKAAKLRHKGGPTILYHAQLYTYTQTSQFIAYGLSNTQKLAVLDLIKNGALDAELPQDNASDSDKELQDRKFAVGDKVDCIDTDSRWLKAEITAVQGGMVHVHYTGYNPKWDEWMYANSPRLAKLGQFSAHEPPLKRRAQ